jgi:hypothetical protein
VFAQHLRFFPSPREEPGIATLQSDDLPSGLCLLYQELVDLGLRKAILDARSLRDPQLSRSGRYQPKHPPAHQPVVENDVCLLEDLAAADGKQAGITGTGTYEVNPASSHR